MEKTIPATCEHGETIEGRLRLVDGHWWLYLSCDEHMYKETVQLDDALAQALGLS